MTKNTMILMFSLLILLSYSSVRAQVNPVYKRMVQNGWSNPFDKGFSKLTPTEIDSEFVNSMGYSAATVSRLKKAGIRVVGRWKKRGPWDSKLWTALSDCIVIGTVAKIAFPTWVRPFYHSIVYVEVDSFLRNDYGLAKGQVAVLQVSGPSSTGLIAIAPNEPRWTVGERVLLYLSASQLITFAANNDMPKLYNRLINSPKVRFQLIDSEDIKSNGVVMNRKEKNLDEVVSEADSVMKIIGHRMPINR